MSPGWLLLLVLLIAAAGYVAGRRRALSGAGGSIHDLHSLPGAYGWNVALAVLIPSLLVLALSVNLLGDWLRDALNPRLR